MNHPIALDNGPPNLAPSARLAELVVRAPFGDATTTTMVPTTGALFPDDARPSPDQTCRQWFAPEDGIPEGSEDIGVCSAVP